MDVFWKHLCWSLRIVFDGVWPAADPDGVPYQAGTREQLRANTPLAGGWFACLWIVRGDLEFFSSALDLECSTSKRPCFLCRANDGTVPWTDCRKDQAIWLSTIWKKSTWEANRPDRHMLFKCCPGVSITTVMPDLMHTKHLGVDQYFYGSALKLLTHSILGRSHEQNIEDVWSKLSEQYVQQCTPPPFQPVEVVDVRGGWRLPEAEGQSC